jgi:hypothetical protein
MVILVTDIFAGSTVFLSTLNNPARPLGASLGLVDFLDCNIVTL